MKIKNINPETVKDAYRQGKDALDNAYKSFKQKAEPIIRETIANAEYAMNPSKAEVLSKKVADAQKSYLHKTIILKELQMKFPNQQKLIKEQKKELVNLEQKAQATVQKYNDFIAKQNVAQRAFETLNK